jgi:hypothetical protein
MESVGNFIVGLFKDLRLSLRWIAFIFCIFLFVLAFYGYESVSGHFYLGKLQQKVSLLESLQNIRENGIVNEPDLLPIYNSTLDELNNYKIEELTFPFSSIFIIDNNNAFGKAISGAFLWILLIGFGFITDLRKNGKLSSGGIGAIFLLMLISLILAWIGSIIPTIINPWINIIGFPIFQLFIILYFYLRSIRKPAIPPAK